MKVLFASSEVVPFAKTGGLADVSGALPHALNSLGAKCSIIMPYYRLVSKNGFSPKLIKQKVKIRLGQEEEAFDLLLLKNKKTNIYFVENKKYFDREGLYGTSQGDYPDNYKRFAFFAKAILSVITDIGNTDILHCNDWQTALIPLYLKKSPGNKIKTLFTIHNMAYQGLFSPGVMPELGLPSELFTPENLEFYGKLNFMKSGIIFSDAINTVSERYSQEIQSKEFGCGLDGLLQTRKSSLYGITNGADYTVWNPLTDKHIVTNYDAKSIKKKEECKKDLLKHFGLNYDQKKPVISMITRLAEQKGIDLVAENIKKILALGVYFVLLGTGDDKYNNLFQEIAKQNKNSTGIKIAFDNSLAHKIEAGSDMFLMPSRYEPCGLNQIYSLKYATVPIVSATGGLDDTIQDFNPSSLSGNGLKISPLSSENLYATIKKAVELYHDKKKWLALQKNGLHCDLSWEKSAKNYLKLYQKILGR